MSFKIPSHKNSSNEQTGRRSNWKSNVRKNKNIVAELTIMAKRIYEAGYVTATANGFTVKMLTAYEITRTIEGFDCRCSDKRDIGTCAHIIAAEIAAAALEAEKQAKITAARELLAAIDAEQTETPSKGFVNVSRAKVLAAVERVKNQDFSCQIRKIETGKYEVYSLSSTNTYRIELNRGIFGVTGWCNCFDFEFARLAKDEVCKHLAAVYFFERRETVVNLNDYSVEIERLAA